MMGKSAAVADLQMPRTVSFASDWSTDGEDWDFGALHEQRRFSCKCHRARCLACCALLAAAVAVLGISTGILASVPGGLSFLRPTHPAPHGQHVLGCLRARLPTLPGQVRRGLMAQVHYPADLGLPLLSREAFEWFRPEVISRIADGAGLPRSLLHSILGRQGQIDPARAPKRGSWPVVVFSSGLFGTLEMYTQFCRELASIGAVVIAVEHEDGSSMYARDGLTGDTIEYVDPPKNVDVVTFRRPFLDRRTEELRAIAASIAASTPAGRTADPDLEAVMLQGDPRHLILVGHSFGSTGIVRYLQQLAERSEASPYKAALLMDLWPEPLNETGALWDVPVPFSLVLSESFAQNLGFASIYRQIMAANGARNMADIFIRGTLHQWIADTQLFLPSWLLRKAGILGSGEYQRTFNATVLAVHQIFLAALNPQAVQLLKSNLAAIDSDVVATF